MHDDHYIQLSPDARNRFSLLVATSLNRFQLTIDLAIARFGIDRATTSQILMKESYDWSPRILKQVLPISIQIRYWDQGYPVLVSNNKRYETVTKLVYDLEFPKQSEVRMILNLRELATLRQVLLAIRDKENLTDIQMPDRLDISPSTYRDVIFPGADSQIEWQIERLDRLARRCPIVLGVVDNKIILDNHHTYPDFQPLKAFIAGEDHSGISKIPR